MLHKDIKPSNILITEVSGRDCPRVSLTDFGIGLITDPGALRPVRAGLTLARALREVDGFEPARLERMVGHRAITRRLLAGESVAALERAWEPDLAAFRELRARYLRYEVRAR